MKKMKHRYLIAGKLWFTVEKYLLKVGEGKEEFNPENYQKNYQKFVRYFI